MAGHKKKNAHKQSLIAKGELPPDKDMILRVKWMIYEAIERYWDKRESLGPLASITCAERLCGLVTQLRNWGGNIDDYRLTVLIPGFAPTQADQDDSGD